MFHVPHLVFHIQRSIIRVMFYSIFYNIQHSVFNVLHLIFHISFVWNILHPTSCILHFVFFMGYSYLKFHIPYLVIHGAVSHTFPILHLTFHILYFTSHNFYILHSIIPYWDIKLNIFDPTFNILHLCSAISFFENVECKEKFMENCIISDDVKKWRHPTNEILYYAKWIFALSINFLKISCPTKWTLQLTNFAQSESQVNFNSELHKGLLWRFLSRKMNFVDHNFPTEIIYEH